MAAGPARGRSAETAFRVAVWIAALLPFLLLAGRAATDGLGADPIEEVTHQTGFAALALLMATLAVTPLRRVTGWNPVIKVRRPLGLFAFFYAVLHFATYLFDQYFSWEYILEDILERPYVTVGFTALVLMVPLALTSTRGAIRRLGKRWVTLHRLVYLSAALGVLHFFWLVKADLREPLAFAAVLALLMAFRLPIFGGKKKVGGAPRKGGRAPAETRADARA